MSLSIIQVKVCLLVDTESTCLLHSASC